MSFRSSRRCKPPETTTSGILKAIQAAKKTTRATSAQDEHDVTRRTPHVASTATGEGMMSPSVQSFQETVSLTMRSASESKGVAHDHEESNWLHKHHPPALSLSALRSKTAGRAYEQHRFGSLSWSRSPAR